MFMAFLLRENPTESDLEPELLVGLVDRRGRRRQRPRHPAGVLLKRINPQVTVVLALVAATAVTLVATLFYGVLPLVLLGLTAGLAQSLAKFCLDATIQRDVPTRVQASAFARSDTTLQLAWVIGGFVGIALPLEPARLGLGVAVGGARRLDGVRARHRGRARTAACRLGRSARARLEIRGCAHLIVQSYASSSSASARSSFAVGRAVFPSGCRPRR